MNKSKEMSKYEDLASVAIDIGTAYSGYAFQLLEDHKRDPVECIFGPYWYHGDMGRLNMKTNTSLLLNPDKSLCEFGYDAERRYLDLSRSDYRDEKFPNAKPQDWFFFKDFKMRLYENRQLRRGFKILDLNGKKVLARHVFAESIRYLKDHALQELLSRWGIKDVDVQWVLTVPAIWSESAKALMRDSAVDAGIDGNALILALEPEVAAIYCKHTAKRRVETTHSISMQHLVPGTEFLVLDLGGGTGDITVHKVNEDGSLHEKHKASGGELGGRRIDQAFLRIWEEVVGKPHFDEMKKIHAEEMMELQGKFELVKRHVGSKGHDLTIHLPPCLLDFPNIVITLLKMYNSNITIYTDKAKIRKPVWEHMFLSTINDIVRHLEDLFQLDHLQNVNTILMVGGLSDSNFIKEEVEKRFPTKKVFRPSECNLAVLKGAVMYGFNQRQIASRICRYTYGISSTEPYDARKHTTETDLAHLINDAQIEDVFKVICKVGTRLYPNKSSYSLMCRPTAITGNKTRIDFYATNAENPRYTTEAGFDGDDATRSCLVGVLEIDLTDVEDPYNCEIEVNVVFGNTELLIQAMVVETKRKISATFKLRD